MDTIVPEDVKNRLRGYSLSELEDVYAYLDRDTYPERHAMVSAEIENRLKALDAAPEGLAEDPSEADPPGFFRRISSSFVDVSIQVLVPAIVYYLIAKTLLPEPAAATPRRRGPPPSIWADITALYDRLTGFFGELAGANPEAVAQLQVIGIWVFVYLAYRAAWHVFLWTRSGSTPGMRELGLRLESAEGGRPSPRQALARFFIHSLLFVFTLGISGLWMFFDGQRRALHDKLAGTRLVVVRRSWEKSPEKRKFD